MKSLVLSSLIFCSIAAADVVPVLPTPYQLDMSVCVNGYLTKDYKITNTDPTTGFFSGLVFEQDRCTVHSGRITSVGYHSACAIVVWDGNGLIQSIDVTNSSAGRIAQTDNCFLSIEKVIDFEIAKGYAISKCSNWPQNRQCSGTFWVHAAG